MKERWVNLLVSSMLFFLLVACSFMPPTEENNNDVKIEVENEAEKSFNTNGWFLAWSEEFDGTSVNTARWTFDIGNGVGGWGNQELQYYRSENARVSGGFLYIDIKRESFNGFSFTSAKLKTQGKVQVHFGKIAARIRMPYGKGMWPAFWMLGRDFDGNNWPAVGEIDVTEMAGGQGGDIGDRITYCTLHWNHNGGYAMYGTRYTNATRLADNFHIYEVEWTPDGIIGRIDGVQYYYNDFFYNGNDDKGNSEFQFPFYLILNCAVGGTFFTPAILNPADVTAPLPQSMVVDWVRYYTNATSVPRTWRPNAANKLIIFSETNTGNNIFTFADSKSKTTLDAWANTCTVVEDTSIRSEGTKSWRVNVGSVGWMGFGVSTAVYGAHLLGYTNATLRFDIRTTSPGPYKVGIKTGAILEAWVRLDSSVGFVADGTWRTVSIPMSRFFAANQWLDLQYVTIPFMFASDGASQSGAVIYIDNVYYTAGNGSGTSSSVSSAASSVSSVVSSVSSVVSSVSSAASSVSSAAATFTHGGEVVSSTSARLWFRTSGWTAGYVIVHYTVNGGAQQNVQMTYNSSTGRWESTITGLTSGVTIRYGFTYQMNGTQYNTAANAYTYVFNGSVSSSSSSVSSAVSSNGTINVPGVISTNVGAIAQGTTRSWTVNCTSNANYRVRITSTSTLNSRTITVTFDGVSVPISIDAGQTVNVDFGWKTTGNRTLSIRADSSSVSIGRVEMVTY